MTVYDCWNKIGVWGSATCPELERAVHCRNCPVYSSAASQLFNREVDSDYLSEWALHFHAQKEKTERETLSVLVFRIGVEWLALPANIFHEVCAVRPIHSLPHRRGGAVLGITNVRGSLLVCVSLHGILGIEPAADSKSERHMAHRRLLVASRESERLVFPADEVHGIHRVLVSQLMDAPATISMSSATYTRAIFPWKERTAGMLDDQLLFYSLNKSLA